MAETTFTQTVEKPIAGLEIKLKVVDTNVANKDVECFVSERKFRTWIADEWADSVTVSVTYKDRDGKESYPFSSFNLDALLEHAQSGEGYIPVVYDGTDYYVQAYLPLTKDGAIQFSNDETMTIEITYDTAQFSTCSTELIESAVASPTWTKFERIPVRDGDLEKDFGINGAEVIMIPLEAVMTNTKITLFYSNGMNLTLNKRRLEAIGRQINDIAYNVNGVVVGGFGRYAVLDVSTVDRVEIRRDTTSAFQIITQTQEMVGDIRTVAKRNKMLRDTSTPYLDAKVRESAAQLQTMAR